MDIKEIIAELQLKKVCVSDYISDSEKFDNLTDSEITEIGFAKVDYKLITDAIKLLSQTNIYINQKGLENERIKQKKKNRINRNI